MSDSVMSSHQQAPRSVSPRGFLPPAILVIAAVHFVVVLIPAFLTLVGGIIQNAGPQGLADLYEFFENYLWRPCLILCAMYAFGLTIAFTLIVADALKRNALVPKWQRSLYVGITFALSSLMFFATVIQVLPGIPIEWSVTAANVNIACYIASIAFGIAVAVFMAIAKIPGAIRKGLLAGLSIFQRIAQFIVVNLVLYVLRLGTEAYIVVHAINALTFTSIAFLLRFWLLLDLFRWHAPEPHCDCGRADCNDASIAI